MRLWWLAALLTAAMPAGAQERSATRAGFTLPADGGKRILVFRPAVSVGAQSTGGMFEPNADWTDRARANIATALARRQALLGHHMIEAPPATGEDLRRLAEYQALFGTVARAVVEYQFFVGNRLPTKKRDNRAGVFDWSLGPGVRDLPGAGAADYALVLYSRDAFGSTGRKLLQVAALLGPRVAIAAGEHVGYAGLVDLRTGDLLWLNADAAMGGDVREADGADKRVGQLLEDFPGTAR